MVLLPLAVSYRYIKCIEIKDQVQEERERKIEMLAWSQIGPKLPNKTPLLQALTFHLECTSAEFDFDDQLR